jgi:hypothetical protein
MSEMNNVINTFYICVSVDLCSVDRNINQNIHYGDNFTSKRHKSAPNMGTTGFSHLYHENNSERPKQKLSFIRMTK